MTDIAESMESWVDDLQVENRELKADVERLRSALNSIYTIATSLSEMARAGVSRNQIVIGVEGIRRKADVAIGKEGGA